MITAEARDTLSNDGKGVCMGRARATDMNNNREVFMPGPAPSSVEAGLNTRMDIWQKTFGIFRKKNCDNKGEQRNVNLTPAQQITMKTLGRRVARTEIVIMEADKG